MNKYIKQLIDKYEAQGLWDIRARNNDKARASIERDYKGNLEDVTITCENCDTVHSLSQYMEILD